MSMTQHLTFTVEFVGGWAGGGCQKELWEYIVRGKGKRVAIGGRDGSLCGFGLL